MPTYLHDIVAAHRALAEADGRDLDELVVAALAAPLPGRGFAARLDDASAGGQLQVIAEIKRRSPSKGELDPALDPAVVARAYEDGGAAALSVLTDERFFGGSGQDLRSARGAVSLPVLRKDFTVGPADVCDARLLGADAVLLIVAALSPTELGELGALARRLALDALVEVHDADELETALGAGATMVGVNQRDLRTFTVDPRRAEQLATLIPDGVVAVAESGVSDVADAGRLADAGYQAVLVGETLVRSGDRRAAVASLCGQPIGARAGAR